MEVITTDYLILGSGVAGLACALDACAHGEVIVLTRGEITDSNTALAQGGVAAAVAPDDSPQWHFEDTVRAGAGGCDPASVRVLVEEGVSRVRELARKGVPFDRSADGRFFVAREAAHRLARVIPACGDATGKAIALALADMISRAENARVHTNVQALEILSHAGRCVGVFALGPDKNPRVYLGRAVVLATGGCGRLYHRTTNSRFCTGSGIAMAWRAGAELADMEYIQFHPTALDAGEDPLPLISEAVRGHGALLVDETGRRFMPEYHPWAELAPRDVVARAIFQERGRGREVFLDATAMGEGFQSRFPSIFEACRKRGLDPGRQQLPVKPAAHFLMGGVRTDLNGATHVPGFHACGEAARTGVHGANRLASNSLLEGLVFSHRTARHIASNPSLPACLGRLKEISESDLTPLLPPGRNPAECLPLPSAAEQKLITVLRETMWRYAGLVRSAEGLIQALHETAEVESQAPPGAVDLVDMACVARMILSAASARTESRGSHYRSDFPQASARLARRIFTFRRSDTQNEHHADAGHGQACSG